MFKLKESDYKALYPMAKRLFKDKYNTPYLSESFSTNIGKRALVEMLFLEKISLAILKPGDIIKIMSATIQACYMVKTGNTKKAATQITNVTGEIVSREFVQPLLDKLFPHITNSSESKGFFAKLFKRVKKIHGIMIDPNRKNIIGLLGKVYQYAFKHPIPFVILAGITATILSFLISTKLRKKALMFARNIFNSNPDEARVALNSAVGNAT